MPDAALYRNLMAERAAVAEDYGMDTSGVFAHWAGLPADEARLPKDGADVDEIMLRANAVVNAIEGGESAQAAFCAAIKLYFPNAEPRIDESDQTVMSRLLRDMRVVSANFALSQVYVASDDHVAAAARLAADHKRMWPGYVKAQGNAETPCNAKTLDTDE